MIGEPHSKKYSPPNETLLHSLTTSYTNRETQIRALTTLLEPHSPCPANIVLHGLTATGKSSVIRSILQRLPGELGDENGDTERLQGEGGNAGMEDGRLRYAIVKSSECITGRHLLETTVSAVAAKMGYSRLLGSCDNLATLAVHLEKMLAKPQNKDKAEKFVLVFDGIDRQRDAPHTLLSALARLSEVIPHLVTVFIVTHPRPHLLHSSNAVYIHFPTYNRREVLHILSQIPPPASSIFPELAELQEEEIEEGTKPEDEHILTLWNRFTGAVYDTFGAQSGRDLVSMRALTSRLWPRFVEPIRSGELLEGEGGGDMFQRLFIAQRAMFREESVLIPSIISAFSKFTPSNSNGSTNGKENAPPSIAALIKAPSTPPLPHTAKILLIAAYLCSYTPSRIDSQLFSKLSERKKRRGGTNKCGGARNAKNAAGKRRRIDRKLLGPQAFVTERVLAVFRVVSEEADASRGPLKRELGGAVGRGKRRAVTAIAGSADVLAGLANLSNLRLVSRLGEDRWKVNVGWEMVRGVGRSVGVDVGEWIVE